MTVAEQDTQSEDEYTSYDNTIHLACQTVWITITLGVCRQTPKGFSDESPSWHGPVRCESVPV
jgi:hypothetical protein